WTAVISCVMVRSARPIRRVVVNRDPATCTRTTSSCHSGNRAGSVTYAKTSSGGRAMSMVDTIADICCPPLVAVTKYHGWERGCVTAERFEAHRPALRAVAYRMLGSLAEADDAVQQSWLHASGRDVSGVANLGAWLTTVVGRVCLDMLRTRKARA